uniref:DUF6535 domain-containing protein n=1 Tax=Moniliophthora roreri TaxID=221103 RepID=A0A0W0EXN4_MONRR
MLRQKTGHSSESLQQELERKNVTTNWKEDIDTLLVFAGLFSAVVAAFAIESYQWLSENLADATVALLVQISAQFNGTQSTERPAIIRSRTLFYSYQLLLVPQSHLQSHVSPVWPFVQAMASRAPTRCPNKYTGREVGITPAPSRQLREVGCVVVPIGITCSS